MKNRRKLGRLAIPLILMVLVLILAGSAFASPVVEKVIHNFLGAPDGFFPSAGLVADAAGNLYGTTMSGGSSACGCGTVFQLSPPATQNGDWTETILHSFQGGNSDGASPTSSLIFDKSGNLFGSTPEGGPSSTGTIFELSPPATSGGAWTETVLLFFPADFSKGYGPEGKLAFDGVGNLYGVTSDHRGCCGTAFQLKAPAKAGGAWTEHVLYRFGSSNSDGVFPGSGLVFRAGALYGSTSLGGTSNLGTVFQLVRQNGIWIENILYNFTGTEGSTPGALLVDSAGKLFGSAQANGSASCGTIFELSPPDIAGNPWQETTLYTFLNHGDGCLPSDSLRRDKSGSLFGTTGFGAFKNHGAAFKLKAPAVAGGPWTLVVLHDFHFSDGAEPLSDLLELNGAFYGTTIVGGEVAGTVFSLMP